VVTVSTAHPPEPLEKNKLKACPELAEWAWATPNPVDQTLVCEYENKLKLGLHWAGFRFAKHYRTRRKDGFFPLYEPQNPTS